MFFERRGKGKKVVRKEVFLSSYEISKGERGLQVRIEVKGILDMIFTVLRKSDIEKRK